MSNIPFFFGKDDDGHWYKVPEYCRQEWDDWRDLPEPGADATDEDWNRYDDPPQDVERCEHPSTYVVIEVSA